ncbi:MAG: MBL fold metallo-hydrolase [Verrucomicrobiota bacterium]|nr:MBL fold metallo-hydrolase [Verrucomicrobiota bacterium]
MTEPESGQRKKWHERNFISEIMIPSLFTPRSGQQLTPRFPKLKSDEFAITWIGHASFLIQTQKHNILIDPNFANWILGFKRLRRAGFNVKDMPVCDIVLITHAHFDHLHLPSLKKVASHQSIVVPKKCSDLVRKLRFANVSELDHWETLEFGDLKITFTPAAHWGARVLADKHRTFGGYIIQYKNRSLYHCGDSTYFHGFKEIGKRFAPEISLLPIGCYETPSGKDHHMGPEDAVKAFEDLQSKWLIPMHYGSFRFSYEPIEEPLQRLVKAALKHAVTSRLRILDEGKTEKF